MKQVFTFELIFDVDAEKLIEGGPCYREHFEASAREFAEELNEFIDRHPFTIGCKVTERKECQKTT